jgi:hypothetical protein
VNCHRDSETRRNCRHKVRLFDQMELERAIGLILALVLAGPFCGGFFFMFALPLAFRQMVIAHLIILTHPHGSPNPARHRELR